MGQMFTNDVDFSKFYPMRRKGEAADTLIAFMQDIGIPAGLHSDNAKELTKGRVADIAKEFWIKVSQSEPYSPWVVRAELCLRRRKRPPEPRRGALVTQAARPAAQADLQMESAREDPGTHWSASEQEDEENRGAKPLAKRGEQDPLTASCSRCGHSNRCDAAIPMLNGQGGT